MAVSRGKILLLGLVTFFVASFALFFIFDSIANLAEKCKKENSPICTQISGNKLIILIIVLIIAGLFFIMMIIVYLFVFLKI